MEAKILKNVKFIALFSILCLLIVIPATFAGDNDTAILASDAIQDDDAIAADVSFEPIFNKKRARACVYEKIFVPLQPNCGINKNAI